MSISYEVKRLRGGSADSQLSIQNGERKVVRTLEEQYLIIFDSDTVDQIVPDPASVGLLSGVPQVGGWSYYDAIQGKFYPNFTCRSVSIERDEANPFIYRANVTYSDESGDQGQGVQSNPVSYAPTITWSLENKSVTTYDGYKNGGSSRDELILPTGNLYEGLTPVRDVPVFVAKVDQIESTLSLAALKARYKMVNDATWQGFAKHTCIIDSITYEDAQIPVNTGGGVTYQNAYKVKYTIKCMDHNIKSLDDGGTVNSVGDTWGYSLARVDDWCLYDKNDDGELTPQVIVANENSQLPSSWYLKSDGTPHPPSKQFGVPPIDQYVVQEEVSFGSFLRV